MLSLIQPGLITSRKPFLLRLIAVLCICLIAVMTTVQVCHTHNPVPQQTDTRGSLPDPTQPLSQAPDHCPLCMAMHSALPAALQTAPEPVLHVQTLHSTAADTERLFRWRFQLASRPPPALGTAPSSAG